MTAQQLLDRLWQGYVALNPHALAVHDLLRGRGETIVNDHIAFRSFAHPRVNVSTLARPFLNWGWREAGAHEFPEKRLHARHYLPPDPSLPKVFISELRLDLCTPELRRTVTAWIEALPDAAELQDDFLASGRPWEPTLAQYEALRSESEYAGWLAAFGYCANHFTVRVNALRTVPSLASLNALLREHGFELNRSGGEIKGSAALGLEQSSTLAGKVEVAFADGRLTLPACYYEFAQRYPDAGGQLFEGFIPESANRIFESTHRR